MAIASEDVLGIAVKDELRWNGGEGGYLLFSAIWRCEWEGVEHIVDSVIAVNEFGSRGADR